MRIGYSQRRIGWRGDCMAFNKRSILSNFAHQTHSQIASSLINEMLGAYSLPISIRFSFACLSINARYFDILHRSIVLVQPNRFYSIEFNDPYGKLLKL